MSENLWSEAQQLVGHQQQSNAKDFLEIMQFSPPTIYVTLRRKQELFNLKLESYK